MTTKTKVLAGVLTAMGMVSAANAAEYEVTVTNLTSGLYFTPIIAAGHPGNLSMFNVGEAASAEMQAIAEGGDVSSMAALLGGAGASVATGGGLVAPGATETLTINTDGGNSYLSVTGMLLPTNDGFLGLNSVDLSRVSGSATYYVPGYDAGTEANDEVIGSGASGEAGFPAPTPVVASGTGTGGTGVHASVEGFVHIHRGVIGDMDPNGGASDINSAVHRWLNPVARVYVRQVGGNVDAGGDTGGGDSGGNGGAAAGAPSAVSSLTAEAYSHSAVEIFWGAADSADSSIAYYEVSRDGTVLDMFDGRSFFEEGLNAGTSYTYYVVPVDAEGRRGPQTGVNISTF